MYNTYAGEYVAAGDVFSFGVVLLELLTGCPPVDPAQVQPVYIIYIYIMYMYNTYVGDAPRRPRTGAACVHYIYIYIYIYIWRCSLCILYVEHIQAMTPVDLAQVQPAARENYDD